MTARGRSLAAGALLLVTGAAIGVAGDHLMLLHRRAAAHESTQGMAATHAALLAQLDTVLRLTPAQHDSIAAILNRHQHSIDSAWQMIHQHLNAGMDSVHQELRAVLDQNQLSTLGDWMQRQASRMHE